MSEKHVNASYLESEKEGYVLVSERILFANANAFAIAITQLSRIISIPEEGLAKVIMLKSLSLAKEAPDEQVKAIVNELLTRQQSEFVVIYPPPDESV